MITCTRRELICVVNCTLLPNVLRLLLANADDLRSFVHSECSILEINASQRTQAQRYLNAILNSNRSKPAPVRSTNRPPPLRKELNQLFRNTPRVDPSRSVSRRKMSRTCPPFTADEKRPRFTPARTAAECPG
jgi:hypothetical protein